MWFKKGDDDAWELRDNIILQMKVELNARDERIAKLEETLSDVRGRLAALEFVQREKF